MVWFSILNPLVPVLQSVSEILMVVGYTFVSSSIQYMTYYVTHYYSAFRIPLNSIKCYPNKQIITTRHKSIRFHHISNTTVISIQRHILNEPHCISPEQFSTKPVGHCYLFLCRLVNLTYTQVTSRGLMFVTL